MKEFDEQQKRLLDLGYAEAAGMHKGFFSELVDSLRSELEKVPDDIPEGNIASLLVIPADVVSIENQMLMIKVGQERGCVWMAFDLALLRNADRIETPALPYLIYNVENGAKMRNISTGSCVKQFAKEMRRGLTVLEGIALVAQYPETLRDHYIDFLGSRYGKSYVPHLWLPGNHPELDCRPPDCPTPSWGSPSCSIV